jgi:hypothetical protein
MNSHVGYVVCSLSTTIDVPVAALPTPMIGAPVPVRLVADWLLTPAEPGVELPDEDPKDEEEPEEGDDPRELPIPDEPDDKPDELDDPNEDEPNEEEDEALPAPTLPCAPWPLDVMPDALPSPPLEPLIPASGWPKNALTVVFASPTWMSFQSALPVIGSTYRWRRKRILLVFSSCSIEPG